MAPPPAAGATKEGGKAAPDGKRRVHVLDEIENTDLNSFRNEYHFRTPFLSNILASTLRDQRDLPMLYLILNIVETIVPGVLLVYGVNLWEPPLPLLTRNVAGLVYYVSLVLLFQERFVLLLHFQAHRAPFYNEFLNNLCDWVIAPFFGIPCGVYRTHHVVMHHIENNHELDMSSTEPYQRDSLAHFGRYWLHFAVLIWVELPGYCFRTRKHALFARSLLGLGLWFGCIALLAQYVSPLATLWVFGIPHVVAMTALAFGNWSQHIFVDGKDRHSNYALTYNCIDCPGNKTTFNDGYHVVHHLNARLHWSELPTYFYQNKDKHIQGNALTFRGVHFIEVGLMVMSGRLRKVAECYVHLGPKETAPTVEEVEERLRSMLRPVPQDWSSVGKKAK